MESLLNFNFLKDISVKKNNEKNTNDKSLLGNGKSTVINQPDSIENEFNNILSDQELDENFLLLEKQKSKKSKEKLNIENTELLLADINIKTSENHSDSNLSNIATKNKLGQIISEKKLIEEKLKFSFLEELRVKEEKLLRATPTFRKV